MCEVGGGGGEGRLGLSSRPGCEDGPPARDSPICLGFTNGKQPKVVEKDVKMR